MADWYKNSPRAREDAAIAAGLEAGKGLAQQYTKQDIEKEQVKAQNDALAKLLADPKLAKRSIQLSQGGISQLGPEQSDLSVLLKQRQLEEMLTPAQKKAEEAFGKKYTEYTAGGGEAAAQKELGQLSSAAEELKGGKRDAYDRIVGSLTSKVPTIQGLVAPAEKARRDRVRSAVLGLIRKTDANPTMAQIEQTFAQVYDPSLPDEEILNNLQRFQQQKAQEIADMEQAGKSFQQTGYATFNKKKPASNIASPRLQQPAPAMPQAQPMPNPAPQMDARSRLEMLRAKAKGR